MFTKLAKKIAAPEAFSHHAWKVNLPSKTYEPTFANRGAKISLTSERHRVSRDFPSSASISELQRQHVEGKQLVKDMEQRLIDYKTNVPDGLANFAEAVERFTNAQWHHMSLEEKVILPAARKYLTDQDWVEIAEAFGKNGDPCFAAETTEEFQALFSRILSLIPPLSRNELKT